jgi:hypothetical protein
LDDPASAPYDFQSIDDVDRLALSNPDEYQRLLKGYKNLVDTRKPEPFDDVSELTQAFDDDSAFVEHLVEGLLPASGSMVVGAKKKVGKSVLLANLTRSVARGAPFLTRASKKGRVLYGSFDEPKAVTLERFEALGMRNQPGVFLWAKRGGVGPNWKTVVRDYVLKFKPDLLIVDTLAKLASIQEINSYGEWNAAYAPLHKLADEFKFSIVVTVHNKKEGAGFDALAGSTAIGGGVDTILVIERDLQNIRTIATEQRVGTDMERTILNMDNDTFELSIGPEEWLSKQREVQQEIITAIGPGKLQLEQIVAAVNRRTLQIKRALYAAVDAGFIIRDGRGIRGDPRLYSVRHERDQETPKKSYTTAIKPGPGPIGDQEMESKVVPLSRSSTGPGVAHAGQTGNHREGKSTLVQNEVVHARLQGNSSDRESEIKERDASRQSMARSVRGQEAGLLVGSDSGDPWESGAPVPEPREIDERRSGSVQAPGPAVHQTPIETEEADLLMDYAEDKGLF